MERSRGGAPEPAIETPRLSKVAIVLAADEEGAKNEKKLGRK